MKPSGSGETGKERESYGTVQRPDYCTEVAIGRIWFYTKEEQSVKRYRVEDTEKEWKRYEAAANDEAVPELNGLREKAVRELGEINAAILETHALMLEDRDYSDSVKNIIETQGVNAEYAVAATGDNFARMLSGMEDEYFRAKAADVQDISERVIGILSGRRKRKKMGKEPVIVVAEDLAPSETVQMDKSKVLGFVTSQGSSQSHGDSGPDHESSGPHRSSGEGRVGWQNGCP